MPLRDIIKDKVISCEKNTPISEVADLMQVNDVGAVLVVESERPVGIVTDRDLVIRCIAGDVGPGELVGRVMTPAVEVVAEDARVRDVIAKMRDAKVRRLPVVDRMGKAVGLISFGDVFGLIAKEIAELSYTTPVKAA